jgi:putative membrane protein
MLNLLLYFVVMAAVMLGMSQLLPGFHVASFGAALIASIVLALLNATLRWILILFTLPLTIVTLGLFLLVINAIVLWVTDILVPGITLANFGTCFVASLILSLVGMLWKAAVKSEK